jgi:hypothetical protein
MTSGELGRAKPSAAIRQLLIGTRFSFHRDPQASAAWSAQETQSGSGIDQRAPLRVAVKRGEMEFAIRR